MRSPPSSSDMCFSSPPRSSADHNLQEEVETLCATAGRITSLADTVSAIIDKDKDAFFGIFGRQIQLLKSRSQAFEDGRVTVYDKVLLALTRNGSDLGNPAAITWYCNEYLGLQSNEKGVQEDFCLQQTLAVGAAISPGHSASVLQPKARLGVKDGVQDADNSGKVSASSLNDPVFKRLWSVYSKAHADYLVVAEKRDHETLDAVKFLRDTAENGIHFLQDKYPNDQALSELIGTYKMAKWTTVELNGGRKRKFDRFVDSDDMRMHKNKGLLPHTTSHDRVNAVRRCQRRDPEDFRPRRGRGPSGIPYGYTRPVDSYYPA